MDKLTPGVRLIMDWAGKDFVRIGTLIAETPVSPSTYMQLKHGRYVPSARMLRDLTRVMEKYAHGIIISPVSNIAHR